MLYELPGMKVETPADRVPKGFYFKNIYDFGRSGEEFMILTDLPVIVDRKIKHSNVHSNARRILGEITEKYSDFPECVVAKNETTVALVNVAVNAANAAARKAAEKK